MARATFVQQFKALIRRNLLLKRRYMRQTMQEFLMPIYFVILLALIKWFTTPKAYPAIEEFPIYSLNTSSFRGDQKGVLYVTPDTVKTQLLATELSRQLGITAKPAFRAFSTSEEAEKAYQQHHTEVLAGIDIHDETLKTFAYTLRFPYDSIPSTHQVKFNEHSQGGLCEVTQEEQSKSSGSCQVNNYLSSGFSHLQQTLDAILINQFSGPGNVSVPQFAVQLMPQPGFIPQSGVIQILAAFYFVMAYSPFVAFLAVNILTEKEKKIKEAMRMMGMRDSAFWASWGIVYVFIIIVVTSIVTLVAFAAKFFYNSNYFFFFLLLVLYGLTIVNFAFMITPFFSKAETGGALASLATILLSLFYLPVIILRWRSTPVPAWAQYLLCLFSPVALALGMDQALLLDIGATGLNVDTINVGTFPFSACLLMLTVDVVLYGLVAFYLDSVLPNEYGMRRPPWFCFMPSFWCGRKAKGLDGEHLLNLAPSPNSQDTLQMADTENYEAVAADLKHFDRLKIYNMVKSFKTKGKTVKAVDGITLDIYEGQITALLGHNGAGKTTLLNMLTGMMLPTSGEAAIYGLDVTDTNDMTELRTMVGVCPQHNILFDGLTCRQHLRFYGIIKGVPPDKIDAEVEQALTDVDLADQGDTYADKLSGGQKRKTCVAIALIGNPRVLFLDEPTAGMDPYSRRHLWKLLKAQKKNKLIVLTTHFMDEADILADRKAIISKGQLRCVGSSLFLKNRFGVGYHLSLVLEPTAAVSEITNIIKEHVPAPTEIRHHGKELTYTLPVTTVGSFQNMFGALEAKNEEGSPKSEELGIKTYGISMTTLEEVFLKLGEEESVDETSSKDSADSGHKKLLDTRVTMEANPKNGASPTVEIQSSSLDTHRESLLTGKQLSRQQFKALMRNRYLNLLQHKPKFFFQVVFPVLYILAGAGIFKAVPTPVLPTLTPLKLEASLYANVTNNVASHSNPPLVYSPNGGDPGLVNAVKNLGLELEEYKNLSDLLEKQYYLGFHFNTSDSSTLVREVVALYNSKGAHSLPVSINTLSSAVLQTKNSSMSIQTSSKPWPSQSVSVSGFNGAIFGSVVMLGIALAAIPASFGLNIIKERELKIKTQLRLSGVSYSMYWGAVVTFDAIQFTAACLVALAILLAFQIPSIMTAGAIISILLLFAFYIPVNMLFVYICSFAFDKLESAQSILPNMVIWSSMLPYFAISMLDMLGQSDVATAIHYIFCCLVPSYPAYGALYYINKLYQTQLLIQGPNPSVPVAAYFSFSSNIPIVYIIPFLHCIWMAFMLRYLEVRSTGGDRKDVLPCRNTNRVSWTVPLANPDLPEDEDEDVAAERQRVERTDGLTENTNVVVKVQNLRKEFKDQKSKGCCKRDKAGKTSVAVRNSSFLVETGEVFGLLGPNGAGKTTTLNMIIADTGPTLGKVNVAGQEVRSNLSQAFQEMGYCPQHDAVWDYLTLKNHLECYAACRGIPASDIPDAINYFMESLDIREHADKQAKKLSGGTKRKLSYAMSMLTAPKVVLLDEPSTGMDPKSKRFMWDTISKAFNNNYRGAILTTHYMDEADALCTKVAIMINGRIECLGSTQHLKNKYGGGYHLEVKLQPPSSEQESEERMAVLHRYITQVFPGAIQNEVFDERAIYKIPQANIMSLAHTFASLERGKEEFAVEEYSFSQATLEQVFLEFAKHQIDTENQNVEQPDAGAANTRTMFQQHSSLRLPPTDIGV